MSSTTMPRPSTDAGRHRPPRRPVRRIPAWWRDLAGVLAWASMLVVVALWVTGGGLHDVTDPLSAAGLSTLGRLTGLISADLLLIQVILMARIPFVEQAYGQDELARRHRLVGFWSFNLMLAHIVLITVGYAGAFAVFGAVKEFVSLVLDAPGMLLALAGTAALTMVVVTSIRAARRRLRYESWHLLHLYAYLGVGLALPHQLWTGADFLTSRPATLFWWGAYLATAGAVLTYRLGLPAYRTLRHRPYVTRVVQESADV